MAWLLTRPALFRLAPERAHQVVMGAMSTFPRLSATLLGAMAGRPPARLASRVGDLQIAGPVGLAAGLDKDGEAVNCWAGLGFGFIELGTVTPLAQPGNPQPRLFRLPAERALINRMGFNNHGAPALAARLRLLRDADRWPTAPVGANIGKNKATPLDAAASDYALAARALASVVDYFTVNVSSPNTPGLRALQAPDRLREILDAAVAESRGKPVWLKLAPDLDDDAIGSAITVAIDAGVRAIVATNTTITRPGSTDRLGESGGLSGRPLRSLALDRIQRALAASAGRLPVVGVGGIESAAQVEHLLSAGCAAVQLYSGFIFHGPGLVHRINRALSRPPELECA